MIEKTSKLQNIIFLIYLAYSTFHLFQNGRLHPYFYIPTGLILAYFFFNRIKYYLASRVIAIILAIWTSIIFYPIILYNDYNIYPLKESILSFLLFTSCIIAVIASYSHRKIEGVKRIR